MRYERGGSQTRIFASDGGGTRTRSDKRLGRATKSLITIRGVSRRETNETETIGKDKHPAISMESSLQSRKQSVL